MISFYLLSSPGDRENNEDSIGMFQAEDDYCFVLADGLGGHGMGEVASQQAVEQVIGTFAAYGKADEACLSEAMMNAQNTIMRKQAEDRKLADMKTTCVALMVGKDEILWAHVGDSRLYCFRKGKLAARTMDHSVPQMLVASGQIREKDIRHHPDRNRLLRVMGIEWEEPRFEIGGPVERDDNLAFLLASDGFWELIDEKKMMACLKRADTPEEWVRSMSEIVVKNGQGLDMDNYSAVAVFI